MKVAKVIYNGAPKNNSWCRWATFRVKHRNNSTNIRFTGDPGSGKSWSALSMAHEMSLMLGKKNFDKSFIFFSIRDAIRRVANNEPPPMSIFFIDEQQIGASAKKHQSKKNQAYSDFFSTIRSNRYIIITTLPFSDMEEKQLRRLYHLEVEAGGANLNNNTVSLKPRFLDHSRKTGKTYQKMLLIVYTDPNTGIKKAVKLDKWSLQRPPQDLIEYYEGQKRIFKKALYERLDRELTAIEEGEEGKGPVKAAASELTEQKLTPYQRAIYELFQKGVKVQTQMVPLLEAQGFTSPTSKLSQNIKWMRKKGVIIIK